MDKLNQFLLVVDGPTEINAIRSKFTKEYNCSPELRKGPGNGATYSLEAYATNVTPTLLWALGKKISYIFCIFDKEKRPQLSCEEIRTTLKLLIIKSLQQYSNISLKELNTKINVFVPDIMFENWIVADVEGIKTNTELVKATARQNDYEGKHGTNVLKTMMKVPYKKVLHGVILFKKVRFEIAKTNSKTFECLLHNLTHCHQNCH